MAGRSVAWRVRFSRRFIDPLRKKLGVGRCELGAVASCVRRDQELPAHLPAGPFSMEVVTAIPPICEQLSYLANCDG